MGIYMKRYENNLQVYDKEYWISNIEPKLKKQFIEWFESCVSNYSATYNELFSNSRFNEIKNNHLKYKILSNLNPKYFVKNFLKRELLYYGDYAIDHNFLKTTNLLNRIDFSNGQFTNMYTSSWGFFNNNIVINKSLLINNEKESFVNENTINKSNAFANENFKKEWTNKTSYEHDRGYLFFDINIYHSLFALTNVLNNLEFNYRLINKDKSDMNFENSKFNKLYQWDFNNESKIRMVMTPWFMEKYLEINNFNSPAKENYQLNLTKGLLYTNVLIKQNQLSMINNSESFLDFLINNISLENFKNNLYEDVKSILKDRYEQLSFLTIIPIIYSEDQKDIYNKLMKNRLCQSIDVLNEDFCEPYFIINEVMNFVLSSNYIKNDIHIHQFIKENILNLIFNKVSFSLYYIGECPKTQNFIKKISRHIKIENQKYNLIYTRIKSQDIYYYFFPSNIYSNTNLKEKSKIDKILNEICSLYKIKYFVIDDGYLSILMDVDISDSKFYNLLCEIINYDWIPRSWK